MYEDLYSYNEEINGKSVCMSFKPNFREAITLYDGENQIISDGKVTMSGVLVLDGNHSHYPDVCISEDAQWGLEDEGYGYHLFVTERTNEIKTPLGPEWNKEFNRLLKKCKDDYYKKRKKEVRLYFYDAAKDKLHLCYFTVRCLEREQYEYSLSRYFSPYCAIDKRYAKPEKDCFILGRIRKTIGLKNSKLLDFIEPLYKIKLDFVKEEYDFGEYDDDVSYLGKTLYKLLAFSVSKNYNPCEIGRIRAYLKCKSEEPEFIAKQFNIKIMDAFNSGNAEEVRKLYDVLETPQDCTNVKFELRLEEEVTCPPNKTLRIFFENGEVGHWYAKLVYENIHNCTDATGVYLGELRDRYCFY